MKDTYKVLYIGDSATGAKLAETASDINDFYLEWRIITTKNQYRDALLDFHPDVILCQYTHTLFSAGEALSLLKEMHLHIPLIIVAAALTNEMGAAFIKQGADDYILCNNLKRLRYAIPNAIEKFTFERQLNKLSYSSMAELAGNTHGGFENYTNVPAMAATHTQLPILNGHLHQQRRHHSTAANLHKEILNVLAPRIALLDAQGYIFEVNEAWKSFGRESGIENDDIWIGQNYIKVSEGAKGSDAYYGTEIAKHIKSIIRGESKYFTMEYPCHSPSVKRWFKAIVSPLTNETNRGAIVLHIDITERVLAEEKIHEIQEQLLASQSIAKIGSWYLDVGKGKDIGLSSVTCSAAALRILGYNSRFGKMTFERFYKMIQPADAEKMIDVSKKLLNGKRAGFNGEYRIVLPSGIPKWIKLEVRIIKNKTKDVTDYRKRIVGIVKDITVSKEQEEKLRQNLEERTKIMNDLISRNNDLEQFTYIISHNLRAPVANILGIAGILNSHELDEDEKNSLIIDMTEAVEKLDVVVKDLNDILQARDNKLDLAEDVLFSKLVEDIKVSIRNMIVDDVTIDYDFSEIDHLFTVRSYLYSIFYNLISNSIKYRRPDVPCNIFIKSMKAEDAIVLTFTDNGMGIDVKQKGKDLFGLYKRFHSHVEGRGMGLFMVKTQVETLGGKISIVSKVNKGTRFKVEFRK